ncbi:phosphate-starvation-inducible PsiE family protein [Rhodoblastus sp.]|uniref:phosphate-starvation-inducible PsiE family protein n=1 Tax=Rhodoblastus sp. TaxID=1962975 RepID=UPI003F9A0290
MDERIDTMDEAQLPEKLRPLHFLFLRGMGLINGFAHLILGLALAASVLLFSWLFFDDVFDALRHANLAQGFLHGLGTLMLLWTVSALISAEIRYMQGHPLTVDTFVEVTIVVVLRKLITMPVQSTLPSPQEFLLWVGSAVMLGIMYLIVRFALTIRVEEASAPQSAPQSAPHEAGADIDGHRQHGVVVEKGQDAMERG